MSLKVLEELNIGWVKMIKESLNEFQLPIDFVQIARLRPIEWKNNVKQAIEKKNREALIENCYKKQDDKKEIKTKTAHIIEKLNHPSYRRETKKEIYHLSKKETKTLIIARFGMLECGKNYQGTNKKICGACNVIDDEEHRLNACKQFKEINYYSCSHVIPFSTVYSDDVTQLRSIMERISSVWNVKTGHGVMNRS